MAWAYFFGTTCAKWRSAQKFPASERSRRWRRPQNGTMTFNVPLWLRTFSENWPSY